MKKRLSMAALLMFALLGLTSALSQADFIQCVALANCGYSDNPDVINGSNGDDSIRGFDGDDIILGGDGNDSIGGDDGNDVIIGGLGAETIEGRAGNDILLAGPDLPDAGQVVKGNDDNDTVNVFASDVSYCLYISNGAGTDVVNLVGFGPYTAFKPFGLTGFDFGWIHLVDPIAGGDIYIRVEENTDDGTETINGLLSPDVTFLPGNPQEVLDCNNSAPRSSDAVSFSKPSQGN